MGNLCTNLTPEEKARAKKSRQIDKLLITDQRETQHDIKLLLLGPGESGKSTIFKQMKIIQIGGGFSADELNTFRYIVYGNIITQMKVLITAANRLECEWSSEEMKDLGQKVSLLPSGGDGWNPKVGEQIKTLWAEKAIKQAYEHRDKAFQLNDSTDYFFDEVDRIGAEGYVPNQQDVLRARVRSTGIEEAEFEFEDMSFRMLDVGGQRSERRKWIHCFDAVTAVVFCAALSAYDQTLREDDTQNRMKESLLLFDEICNSPWFRETAFILFLNKTDLFQAKISHVDLRICFPNYDGGDNFQKASEYIKNRFLELKANPDHKIYVHFTCAVNTDNVKFVFKAVRETLLNEILAEITLI